MVRDHAQARPLAYGSYYPTGSRRARPTARFQCERFILQWQNENDSHCDTHSHDPSWNFFLTPDGIFGDFPMTPVTEFLEIFPSTPDGIFTL